MDIDKFRLILGNFVKMRAEGNPYAATIASALLEKLPEQGWKSHLRSNGFSRAEIKAVRSAFLVVEEYDRVVEELSERLSRNRRRRLPISAELVGKISA